MIYLGIDPGLTGGIAALEEQRVETWAMPAVTVRHGHVLDVDGLRMILTPLYRSFGLVHAFLEYAQAMPDQGASSGFKYGRTWGETHAVLVCLGFPFTVVTPRVWTKRIHAGIDAADSKARSRIAVQRLFPAVNLIPPQGRKPHEGMMDALLIAEWGRRTWKE